MVREDKGSALIWFVFLVALLSFSVLTLAASVHQYLFARELTDFTEQFAAALKTRLQIAPSANFNGLANDLLLQVAQSYSFPDLRLKHLSLGAGETVRVVFCSKWTSPVNSVDATRTICEIASAR